MNKLSLSAQVTAHWKKFFHDQLPEKYTAEQVKSIKKKFLKSVQTNVVYGPSSLSEFTRWRVKMIAEEFLAYSLGLELNSDPEPEEKMDENEEEESTESPREAAEDKGQVGDFSSLINNVLFISYEFSSTCQFAFMMFW